MLYHALEMSQSALAPARAGAQMARMALKLPWNPWSNTAAGRWLDATCEVFESLTRRYERPAWDLPETTVNGKTVAVEEQIITTEPFCTLRRFHRVGVPAGAPRLLVVAPLSGHFATLLRDTVRTLIPDHDVYVTDWADARDVPLSAGRFDFEDYVDHVIRYLRLIGPGTHVLAVCQPAVPVMAAVSVMSSQNDPAAPASMTLIGGPIDTRRSPTSPNDLAQQHPLSWFERRLTTTVPAPYAGAGRKVYPGFFQLSGFISMNLRLHVSSHWKFFENLVRNDGEGSQAHRRFYDEYLAVMDLSAEFYLDTIRKVFQEHQLPRGTLTHRGLPVRPQDITRTALLTIEGGKDDISGPGQTVAAHGLCSGLRRDQKQIYVHPTVGHYGTFSGRRWREEIGPLLRDFIRTHEPTKAALVARTKTPSSDVSPIGDNARAAVPAAAEATAAVEVVTTPIPPASTPTPRKARTAISRRTAPRSIRAQPARPATTLTPAPTQTRLPIDTENKSDSTPSKVRQVANPKPRGAARVTPRAASARKRPAPDKAATAAESPAAPSRRQAPEGSVRSLKKARRPRNH